VTNFSVDLHCGIELPVNKQVRTIVPGMTWMCSLASCLPVGNSCVLMVVVLISRFQIFCELNIVMRPSCISIKKTYYLSEGHIPEPCNNLDSSVYYGVTIHVQHYVFELVGCVPSCCVFSCVSCFRIREQDTQQKTQQEKTQPTNLNTYGHREDLYIFNNISNNRKV
jgi:hypothetical protein